MGCFSFGEIYSIERQGDINGIEHLGLAPYLILSVLWSFLCFLQEAWYQKAKIFYLLSVKDFLIFDARASTMLIDLLTEQI